MSLGDGRLRYAFAITTGPNAGLRVGGWRLWTHQEDTYIAVKGNPWKASLHADASWRVAVTSEHQGSGRLPVVPGGRATSWDFTPTRFESGGRLAFVIAVFRNALIEQQPDPKETLIEVADRWDRLTAIYVWMTESGVTLNAAAVVGGPLPLNSGRRVWITAGEESIPPSDPEPVPAGALIEPLGPANDDVTAPGFLVRGVNLGGGLLSEVPKQ
jgi:hypothetical protein